ncbi:MAG: hypothetical protein D6741_16480, partial [Planctomycetota bacterium]
MDAAGAELLQNGGMEAGDDIPDGWRATEGVQVVRDTRVAHEGTASARLDAREKSGNVNQMLTGIGGKAVAISGWVKAQPGTGAVQLFVLNFDTRDQNDWKSLGWQTLVRFKEAPADWTRFEGTYEFPPEAGTAIFGLLIEGKGVA